TLAERVAKFVAALVAQLLLLGLEETARAVSEPERRQPVGEHRTGIDADPVGAQIRHRAGGVSMHDHLAETLFRAQELAADPDEVQRALRVERHAGTNAGKHEEIITERHGELEVVEEAEMCPG